MFRNNQKRLILFVIIFFVSMLLLIRDSYAALTGTIIVTPPGTAEMRTGSDPIGLAAQVAESNLEFLWELVGPGELKGNPERSSVFYRPPDRIDGESAEAIITVTVTNSMGEETTESKTFTIIPSPPPTPTPEEGWFTKKKVALGVGAAVALGGGIALAMASTDGDDNSDDWVQEQIDGLSYPVACCKEYCVDTGISDCVNSNVREFILVDNMSAKEIKIEGNAEARADTCYENGIITAVFSDRTGSEVIPCQSRQDFEIHLNLSERRSGQLKLTIDVSDWCTILHSLTVFKK